MSSVQTRTDGELASVEGGTIEPALPIEARLDMPTQSLRNYSRSGRRRHVLAASDMKPWLARIFVFGAALTLTIYGASEMYAVVSVGSTTGLQYVLLVLFTINFSWIALAFTAGLSGFCAMLIGNWRESKQPSLLRARTAILMPVYNEQTARTFAAVQAIHESVDETGLGHAFDYFVLSDSTQPDAWIAEERAFLALRERLGPGARIFYRHRPKNIHRKAGNIADFVTRWGGAYDFMLVLDADSLMTGACIVRLAAEMESDPDAGIIQTLPLIINRNTLFARVQQFAARLYGPLIATGLQSWMGRDGNYWGHNAIIRTKAFAQHCGLPDLKGQPPFGGHILSHDFVEAALMLRAGWTVRMLADLPGSYEESPPTLIDLAVRDRRWCQGNLQHSRVIGATGLTLASRQHFATGMMAYLASPFWLAQLVVGIMLVLQTNYIRPEYFTQEFSLFPAWPRFDAERALALFGLTMGILLAPKALGLVLALFDRTTRRGCGGAVRMVLSALLETLFSALFAPILMLIQSGSVFQIIAGRDTGWNPQRRDDGTIPFRDILRRHRWHLVLGVIAGLSAFLISTSLFLWMSPTILGLILAVPLSWFSGMLSLGLALKRVGILTTPEETTVPPIVVRANALALDLAKLRHDDADGLRVIHAEPSIRAAHVAMLPKMSVSMRGVFEPDRAMARAKLDEAASIDEAAEWLNAKERISVLGDARLLARLARLPATAR